MKKFKKYILPLLIVATVLALIFSLAACGDKNVNDDNNENPDEPGETKNYEDLSESTAMDLFLIAGQPTLPETYTINATATEGEKTEKVVFGSLGKSDTTWYTYQDEETSITVLFVKKGDEFFIYDSLYGYRKLVEWEFLTGVNDLRDMAQITLMNYAMNLIDLMLDEYDILRGDGAESYTGKEYDSGIKEATYTADVHEIIDLPGGDNTPTFGKLKAKKTFDVEDQVTEMVVEFKADPEYVAPGLDKAEEKCIVVIDRQTPVAPEIPSTATEVPPDTTATLSFDGISSEIDSGRGDLTDYFETDFETTGLTPGAEIEIPQVLHFPDSNGYVTNGIFQGWYYDKELTIPVEETDNAKYKVVLGYTGQTTLYPKFNMNIDYQLVGGEFPDGKAEMTAYTLNAILSIIPEKTGYAFDGWYAESTYQMNWATVTDRVYPPEHAKFYAKWVKKVKVSYETNINGYKIAEDLAAPGKAMEQYPTPIAEGKVFDGWYLDEGLTQSAVGYVITEDITLYAKYR